MTEHERRHFAPAAARNAQRIARALKLLELVEDDMGFDATVWQAARDAQATMRSAQRHIADRYADPRPLIEVLS